MAQGKASLGNYLTCMLCSEMFKDPVSLDCDHSFCTICLQQLWRQYQNKFCPICKKQTVLPDSGVNTALKEFADAFAGRLISEPEKEVPIICPKHKEEPQKFCKDEQRALCGVCDFPHDESHKVISTEQAVSELKDQLRYDLKSLQEKRNKYKIANETYNEMVQLCRKQLFSTEKQIRAHFNKLQQFLSDEEESRVAALREEEEQKAEAMTREAIEENLASFSDTVFAVEEELLKHNVSFLRGYRDIRSRTKAQCSLSDRELLTGALTDVAKHLGNLSFNVWRKMKDNIRFSPVILDPNTASKCFYLSDDLTSVRHGDIRQQLPDNPERYINHNVVLGSEGFLAGKHSWDVEVGDHPDWILGVVKESVERKGETNDASKFGFWCLQYCNGKYTDGFGGKVKVEIRLEKIRVQVNYEKGEVSFYDAEDMIHIFTHSDTFTEKMFPCFGVGDAGDANTKSIKICPSNASQSTRFDLSV